MTETRNRKNRYHWLLWWRIEPEELERQVRDYNSLGKLKSARGLSALLLILSGVVSIVVFYLSTEPRPDSFSDTVVLLGLAVLSGGVFFVLATLIYRGNRWAMICAMIYWTFDKAYQIYLRPKYAFGSVIWWTTYMQAFYMAYLVEKQRLKASVQPIAPGTGKNPMDMPGFRGQAGPPCPLCGSPTVARAQQDTDKLYFGCTNFRGGCRFNGCRDVQPQLQNRPS